MTSPAGGVGLGSALIQVAADVRNFARQLQRDVQRELRRINWTGATGQAAAAGRLAGAAYARGFRSEANDGPGLLSKIFTKLNPALLLAGKGLLGVVGALHLIAALVPVIGGLLTITGAFAAALPALAVTGLLVAKTLSTAFKGVGEALKAVAEGDAKALDAAMKNLSPSAQAFVREVAKIKPQFDALKKAVQEGFFAQFKGAFTDLANPGVLAALQTVMTGIAGDFGKAAAAIARVIGAAGQSGQLARIFAPLERSIARILTLAPSFTKMFLGLAEAAGPFIEVLSKAVASKLGGLIDLVNRAVASGALAKLFSDALSIMSAVGGVLVDLGSILTSLFSIFIDQGGSALGVIASLVKEFAQFLQSTEGTALLTTFRDGLEALSKILRGVLLPLLPVAAKLLGAVFGPLADLLEQVAQPLSDLASALADMLLPVIEELTPVFVQLGYELVQFLVPFFKLLTDHITDLAPVALQLAEQIGPLLVFFMKALGDLLISLLPLFEDMASFLENNSELFQILVGAIGFLVLALTAGIVIITKVIDLINWWRETVMEFLESHGIEGITGLVGLLVNTLGGAAAAIFTHWSDIKSFFSEAWDSIVGGTSSGVGQVTALIGSLPGRIASFGAGMYNAALGLGRSIGQGLSNIGNFASDIGGKIVGAIKNGINAVIGSINRGIAQIDNFIPGNLPRLSFFERGGIVDEPTLSLIGERGKKEVVLPLTDAARTAQLAQQSGLIDLLRSSGALGDQTPVINITAILDGFGVLQVVDQRIDTKTRQQGRELALGTRGV